jgi:dTDP-glucose pyrophosphorylase
MVSDNRLRKIIVEQNILLKEALQQLNNAGEQVLLVVDAHKRLCGLLTDGDFRRYILKNQSLEIPVKKIMNTNFLALPPNKKSEAREILKKSNFNQIPIIDDEGLILEVVTSLDFFKEIGNQDVDIPVVIMAGGKGTRLSPLTNIIPKPLMPVGEKTMMEAILANFEENGFGKYYIIVNHKKEMIKSYYAENNIPYQVEFVDEEEFLGTAGGLSLLKNIIHSTFILSNCDILAKFNYKNLLNWHFDHEADITIVGVRKEIDIPYGVININGNNYVTHIEEKPSYNFIIVSGVYVVESSLLDMIPENSFYNMDQFIKDCIQSSKKVTCYPLDSGWFDIGQFKEYKLLLKEFGVLNV